MNACWLSLLCLLGALALLVEGVTVQVWPHPYLVWPFLGILKRGMGFLWDPRVLLAMQFSPFKRGGENTHRDSKK